MRRPPPPPSPRWASPRTRARTTPTPWTTPIDVTLTFGEGVDVTGDPYLLIDVVGTNRRASYHSGSATAALVFRYTVLAGDDGNDGGCGGGEQPHAERGTIVGTDDSTSIIQLPVEHFVQI